MSQFMVVFLGILAVLLLVIVSGIRSKLRLKKRLAAAWGSRERVGQRPDSQASLYESFLLDREEQSYDSLVDDQTWEDLDFHQIFEEIDTASQSSLGSEYLYSRLRLLRFEPDQDLEALQCYLSQHPQERFQLQLLFGQIGRKNHNQAKKIVCRPAPANHRGGLYLLLALLPLLSPLFFFVSPPLGYLLPLLSMTFNIFFYLLTRWSLDMRLDSMGYLVRVFYVGGKIARMDLPGQDSLKKASKAFSRAKLFGPVFRPQSGVSELEIFFLYINSVLLLPHLAQAYISKRLVRYNQEARTVLELLGRLEAAIAILNYKESLPFYARPEFSEEGGLVGRELYHPLLSQPVSNDVQFSGNVMISGDNASGKSTYLRTVAINAVLAQALGFACGRQLRLQYGHVLTAMDVSDDIGSGDSYFIAESRAILRMLDSLEEGGLHYFFIDELFKGTNTVERIGAGLGIIRWLAQRPCLYMVSSHDVELVGASGGLNEQYHFDSQYIKGEIVFDYQIKPGSALTKNAVNTLESLDYPAELTEAARRVIHHYEQSGQWTLQAAEGERK
ncbi:MutS-related protein [Streptococcus panodentis]|uniref:DNA mismatch repair proteins mutS family domain-containing protein n=1 Tax=Streptococcus panodentis TaxID=1581472 RepID=A0ABS5AUL8_9STRE|nr:hypothetical protein [Streptococcus panodentis]MBP2619953.1 hypothetical protein [Streptococcus panodentis]